MALYRQPSQPCTKTVKDRDVIYIPYSYEDDVKKVTSKVRDLDVVYVLDVSFGADSKTIFKDWS